jgi:hypothetical protein
MPPALTNHTTCPGLALICKQNTAISYCTLPNTLVDPCFLSGLCPLSRRVHDNFSDNGYLGYTSVVVSKLQA